MAEVRLTPQAEKQFNKLPRNAKFKVEKGLIKLAADPILGKKLRGELEGEYSLKAWPYRIIYRYVDSKKIIYITSIIHRQSAYN